MDHAKFLSLDLRDGSHAIHARRCARDLAVLLGFERIEALRIATAVSLIARHVIDRSPPARLELRLARERDEDVFDVTFHVDHAHASHDSWEPLFASRDPLHALVERCTVQTTPTGLRVHLATALPCCTLEPLDAIAARVAGSLTLTAAGYSSDERDERERESAEIFAALDKTRLELTHLHAELDDTNRGVVALYAELEDRAREVQRVLDLKSRFLSNITHEFRTPLNSIIGLSRMLLQRIDGELTAEQEKQARFIDRAARDLSELVNDLLDLAKTDAGKTELCSSTFSVDELFATLRGMLRPLSDHAAGVNLFFTPPQPPVEITCDEPKLSQILRNLVSNALKYTPSGEVRVSAHLDGTRIVFRVSDTGIGIPPEHLENIFEEFYQVRHPLQQKSKGTGLGLALCRRFVELMGGTISVQSTPDVGSTFTVNLPLDSAQPTHPDDHATHPAVASPPPASSATDDTLRNAHLVVSPRQMALIIDPDANARATLRAFVEKFELIALEARTAAEAFEVIREHRPSLVFCELHLPDASGASWITSLHATLPGGSLVVHTSQALNEEERAQFTPHATSFILKGQSDNPAYRTALIHEIARARRDTRP